MWYYPLGYDTPWRIAMRYCDSRRLAGFVAAYAGPPLPLPPLLALPIHQVADMAYGSYWMMYDWLDWDERGMTLGQMCAIRRWVQDGLQSLALMCGVADPFEVIDGSAAGAAQLFHVRSYEDAAQVRMIDYVLALMD